MYEEPIKLKLYQKVGISNNLTVLFSPSDIHINFIIPCDDAEKFMDWFKKGRISSSGKMIGNNPMGYIIKKLINVIKYLQ